LEDFLEKPAHPIDKKDTLNAIKVKKMYFVFCFIRESISYLADQN